MVRRSSAPARGGSCAAQGRGSDRPGTGGGRSSRPGGSEVETRTPGTFPYTESRSEEGNIRMMVCFVFLISTWTPVGRLLL